MSIFDDLNERYARFEAAQTLQHNLLIKAVGALPGGFGKHIGLTVLHWHDEDGKAGARYIRLGVGAPESFEEKPWVSLTSMNGVVSFSLAVTVDSNLPLRPRMTYVFEGTVRFCPDGYDFAFKGLPSPIIVSPEKVIAGELSAVYDALVESLYKSFDPSLIEIRN